ncbi:O-antigen ligase family protein [Flavobacteriaceae bacterium GSB9]|nr:O-antigen ligase family protein [Flavobacteriaceae bacterium GSB9]
MNQKHLTLALFLNASILLFPSNFKFFPVAFLGLVVLKNYKQINWNYLVLMSIPYLIILLGVLHSSNLERAFSQIQTGASLFLYPLCFSMIPAKSLRKIKINKINNAFIVSIFIFTAVVFLYYLIIKGESWVFLVHHYITLIDKLIYDKYQIHSLYLALLLTISIILSLRMATKTKNKYTIFLYVVNVFYCLSLLAIMNKRASVILIIITSLLFLFTLNKKIKKVAILFAFGAIALLLGLVVYLPRFNGNSFLEFKKIEQSINDPKTSIGTRVVLNKATLEIFKSNPFFGVGSGDDREILSEFTAKLSDGVIKNYNSHNQFSSYLIKTGAFGLCVFLFYCCILLKIALKSKDIVFICMFIIFCGNMLIENILEREAGVLVFSFFINYYSRIYYNEKR